MQEVPMTVRDYARVLRQQWVVFVLCVILGIGGAVAANLLLPRQYESAVTWYFTTEDTSDRSASAAYQGSLLSEQRVKSYQELVTGPSITREVVERLNLDITPLELADSISTSTEIDTVLLTAAVTDRSPERAHRIADTLARVLADRVVDLERPADPNAPPMVNTRIVEPAEVPTEPVSPRPLLNLALGLLVGVSMGIGLAMLRNAIDNSIKSGEDLEQAAHGPILGMTTFSTRAVGEPLIVNEEPHAHRVEEFRTLRTNLRFIDVDRPRKALVVTSPLPDEGKTTLACNLAISFAASGSRVVIVESDLRRPRAADYLGLDRTVGLTTVMTGRVTLDMAVQEWDGGSVHVLASGQVPPNPSELLGSQQMAEVLSELRRRYDVVLLDAPPLLPVTDAAVLAARVDGAVLVCRYGKTTRPQVEAATATLRKVSARMLGTVLTMAPSKRTAVYGQYGYYGDSSVDKEEFVKPLPAETATGKGSDEFSRQEPTSGAMQNVNGSTNGLRSRPSVRDASDGSAQGDRAGLRPSPTPRRQES
jgi:capsular exopolysaccharide synthesis family protein